MAAASDRKQTDTIAICGRKVLLGFANFSRKALSDIIVLGLTSDIQKK
jgi:hypothetical protein